MAELHVAGLTKFFGHRKVLDGVDLDVASGRLVTILGASGSGKTTLLRLLCGFEHADAGTIAIAGRTVTGPGLHVPPERRHIGYVAQEGALFPHLTVAGNVAFGLPRRLAAARRRVDSLLELVGLPVSYGDRPPHELSGGEQQRVALARALAPEPTLVLLDEPFSALDAGLRVETRNAVAAALRAAGSTALLVTHDQAEALSMSHEVAVLREGRLVQVADPATLYRRPADAALARFVGEAVLLPGRAEGGVAMCALGPLSLATAVPDGAVEVLVRPEQIRLAAPAEGIAAHVEGIAFYGHDASVHLTLTGAAGSLRLSARVPGHSVPRPGDTVGLTVDGPVIAFPLEHGRRP